MHEKIVIACTVACLSLATVGTSQSAHLRSTTASIHSKGHIAKRHPVALRARTAGRKLSRVRTASKTAHLRTAHKRVARAAVHRKEQRSAQHELAHASGLQGIASVYSGEKTANGEYARASGMTAAHKSLPFGTLVKVTNKNNGQSVVVRINDRGPFVRGRVIDLMPAAAKAIGFSGLAPVMLSVVGRA